VQVPRIDESREDIFDVRSRSDLRVADADYVGADGTLEAQSGPSVRFAMEIQESYPHLGPNDPPPMLDFAE
jgi:hypothetical protein